MGWRITTSWYEYLGLCVIATLVARLVVSSFKALGVQPAKRPQRDKYLKRFIAVFVSTTEDADLRDYWLPALIGFAEAAAYPVLISLNKEAIIGGWLAIKTAGQWGVWNQSRTAFNRFLVGNLVIFAFAYFCLVRFVEKG